MFDIISAAVHIITAFNHLLALNFSRFPIMLMQANYLSSYQNYIWPKSQRFYFWTCLRINLRDAIATTVIPSGNLG